MNEEENFEEIKFDIEFKEDNKSQKVNINKINEVELTNTSIHENQHKKNDEFQNNPITISIEEAFNRA